MHKINKNELGFSAVEALLILIIVAIIGFVGWYVWKQRNSSPKLVPTTTTSQATSKPATTPTTKTSVELTTINATDGFSFSYPSKGWNVTAYGPDETVNGGQVQPSDKSAIQWRIVKDSSSSQNTMCVDITVSPPADAGIAYRKSPGTVVGSGKSGLEIWRINDTSSDPNQSYGAVSVLESPGLEYVKLSSGKAVTAFASFTCAQKMSTTYSYKDQVSNADYITGIDVLKSLTLN